LFPYPGFLLRSLQHGSHGELAEVGALFYPSINPANDNEFYVACDMSQLFHSTDFGASYSQVSFTKLQVGNMSTYEFTSNNNIAFCITNDGNINYPVRTLDGGTTWTSLVNEPLPVKMSML
jgi:photosystem II stability/assembly factor-like uncharacterized protein